MNIRPQDIANTVESSVMMGASAFEGTIAAAVMAACPNGNCGVIDISPVLQGQMTAEELGMLYAEGFIS